MAIERSGSAVWGGGFKDGAGVVSTETGALKELPYSVSGRFEDGPGTNPEELLGAAHASCYVMATSLLLGNAGMNPEKLAATSVVTLAPDGDGFSIPKIAVTLTGHVPGAEEAKVLEVAEAAKGGCPVSKLFDAEITLDATITV